MCPVTKLEGGLQLVHEADDDDNVFNAFNWLKTTAITAETVK